MERQEKVGYHRADLVTPSRQLPPGPPCPGGNVQFEQVSEGCEGCGQYSKGVGRGSRHGERGEMEVEEVSAEEKEVVVTSSGATIDIHYLWQVGHEEWKWRGRESE